LDGYPVTKIVEIPDSNLEEILRDELNIPEGDITNKDMLKLSYLTVSNMDIEDISGLEYASNLQNLFFEGNKLSDISPLKNLLNLKRLSFYGIQVRDLNPLACLNNLEEFTLRNCGLTGNEFAPLKKIKGLIHLDLGGNNISDLSEISNLTRLQSLSLNDNCIKDISALGNLTNLQKLQLGNNYADGNEITDISALGNLTNLYCLGLGGNKIIDISPHCCCIKNLNLCQARK
jgi:Leucine-rich repeat (LRR) protein